MNVMKLAGLVCLIGLSATPVLADDAMGTMSMMKGGEVVAIMPDGHMGTMMMKSGDKMMGEMMKMSKPLDHCFMMMTGADGKTYVVDTSTPEAKKACEKTAM
ncbi:MULTISPECIES: hypothetical protein [Mesorhizobium]|uniref:hypothetical protein n=1 Tax=Mesorhizobium TaxID=68287 RepID=UPI0010A96C69|nr:MULTISPECIES: hypothetical protein [Mesorhizobium]